MTKKKKEKKEPRMCFFAPLDAYIPDHGFRVSIVREGEYGHYPTGVWPNDGTQTMPYFCGVTGDYEEAEKWCDMQNERMGISRRDATMIVASSMFAKRGKS